MLIQPIHFTTQHLHDAATKLTPIPLEGAIHNVYTLCPYITKTNYSK